jgi:hypothetical protein
MRSLALISLLAAVSFQTLAAGEEPYADKCKKELTACDAANGAGRSVAPELFDLRQV